MAINATPSANVAPPPQPAQQVGQTQQSDPKNEVGQAQRIDQAQQDKKQEALKQEALAQQAQSDQSRPSVNTQGQTTGSVINTKA